MNLQLLSKFRNLSLNLIKKIYILHIFSFLQQNCIQTKKIMKISSTICSMTYFSFFAKDDTRYDDITMYWQTAPLSYKQTHSVITSRPNCIHLPLRHMQGEELVWGLVIHFLAWGCNQLRSGAAAEYNSPGKSFHNKEADILPVHKMPSD